MNEALFTTNNLWLLVATVLVFIMHLGFATLEAGFVQKKNTVNILFKNVMIIAIGLLTYYVIGFNWMYPTIEWNGVFAMPQFGLNPGEGYVPYDYVDNNQDGVGDYTIWSDFIFQGMFAATCCTIVSGAVAERIKLMPFLIFCIFFVSISYPITGSWQWGSGWLSELGFADFAGSTLVHSVGGWGALAVVLILGARKGKYTAEGIKPIPGHSLPLATVGVFLLWFGWFGFNGGSVLNADAESVSLVFVTTSLAAAAGAVGAFFTSWYLFKGHDLSMVLNGVLGGLVGITAGADVISPLFSIVVGLIAGIIIPFSVVFFDKMKIDDPVGATSVHLICGIWGTLAVGFFGGGNLLTQLIGVLAIGAFTFVFAFSLALIIDKLVGLRVDEEEELKGLDVTEHGMQAYQYAEAPYSLAVK